MIIELLSSNHNRKDFQCGVDLLDNYLHNQVNQDIKRKLSACFVCTNSSGKILGYYTLSNSSVPQKTIPDRWQKRLPPSYTSIPTTLLGRLAVDSRFKNQGIGEFLLTDALKRSFDISLKIGSFAVITDPLDITAENFYSKYGFIKLPDSGKMFIAMQTLRELF